MAVQIHFAEEWNELHHLQIMESLGGDQYWIDRFAAQHAAVFYYWVLVFFFAFSPELAYVFSELVEVRHSLGCRYKACIWGLYEKTGMGIGSFPVS